MIVITCRCFSNNKCSMYACKGDEYMNYVFPQNVDINTCVFVHKKYFSCIEFLTCTCIN